MTFLFYIVMINNVKSQIQSLNLLQKGNQRSIRPEGTINVLGIAGSLRQESYSTLGLKIALEEAKKYGSESYMLDLRELNLPLYDPGGPPSNESDSNNISKSGLERITTALKWADALILASPDYHGSMSGTVKNFLDYFWEEFAGKTFAYIVASHEKGLTVMEQMRTAVRQCYGWSLPYGVSINGPQDFTGDEIRNTRLSNRLRMMARDLVVYGRLLRDQFIRDFGSTEPDTFAAFYRP